MPTKKELELALINADKQGDVEAARLLANALKKQSIDNVEKTNVDQVETVNPMNPVLGFGMEAIQGLNRGAYGVLDLAATVPNALLELSGSDARIPKINEQPFMNQKFMDEGLGRDIARSSGEVSALALGGGALLRKGAEQLPKLASNAESIGSGVLRQLANTTPKQDVVMGSTAAGMGVVGGEVGENLGGPTGRMIGQTVGEFITPYPSANIVKSNSPNEVSLKNTFDRFNVDSFPAQLSNDPYKISEMDYVSQLTPGSKVITPKLMRQNEQAGQAVDDALNTITTGDAPSTYQNAMQNAAQNVIKKREQARDAIAGPLYRQAFNEGGLTNLQGVRNTLKSFIKDHPNSGEVAKSSAKVLKMLAPKKVSGKNVEPNLEQLQNTKLEIDNMINRPILSDNALAKTTQAKLLEIQQFLLREMDVASPKFKQARETFQQLSPPVNEAKNSIIGKISELKTPQMKNVLRNIFDPGETNLATMQKNKKMIVEADPEAWNLLIRAEVEKRLSSIKPVKSAVVQNEPSQLSNAIFGNKKQEAQLLAAMNKDQRELFRDLKVVLDQASLGRLTGSPTATRTEIAQSLKGGFVQAIRDFVSSPVDKTVGMGSDAMFDKRVSTLATALTDVNYQPLLKSSLEKDSGIAVNRLLYFIEAELMNQDLSTE